MARVKMNSPMSTQPVIKGPAVIRRMGLIITIPSPIYHVFLLSDYNHANESLRRKTWTSS